MKPGVYRDIPEAEYHAIDAVSNSRLTRLLRSPAHLAAYIVEPPSSTPAQVIGSAADTLTLEPDLFPERFTVAQTCAAVKKGDGERCTKTGSLVLDGEWFCRTSGHAPDNAAEPTQTLISEDDMARCKKIAASVHAHPRIGKLLGSEGRAQLTVVWEDAQTGLLCKGRIDYLADRFQTVVDLKTTVDARPNSFERSIADYGYHRQLPFYEDGLAAHGIDMRHLVFAAVEKTDPFAVAGYRLMEGAADEGRIELRALLHQYANLKDRPMSEWEAYGNEITDISIPAWAFGRVVEGVAA